VSQKDGDFLGGIRSADVTGKRDVNLKCRMHAGYVLAYACWPLGTHRSSVVQASPYRMPHTETAGAMDWHSSANTGQFYVFKRKRQRLPQVIGLVSGARLSGPAGIARPSSPSPQTEAISHFLCHDIRPGRSLSTTT